MNNIISKKLIPNLLLIFCSMCILLFAVSLMEQKMSSKRSSSVLAAGTCPAGGDTYVLAGDFCIEEDLHDAGVAMSWGEATIACVKDDGAHLCKASEWAQACNMQDRGDITLNGIESQWEWTDDFTDVNKATKIGNGDCETYGNDQPFNAGTTAKFRCCKNAVN